MDVKKKIANMSTMRRIVMAKMFDRKAWDPTNLYLGSSGNREKGNPMFSPKRKKLKSWQKK